MAQNVNLPLYLNSKIHLLGNVLQSQIKKVHLNLKFQDCLLARKIIKNKLEMARSKPITYGHLLTGKKGFINIQDGEVFHILKCSPAIVQLRATKLCYKNLPIFYQNRSAFIEPTSRTITSVGNVQPCSKLTPTLFKLNGNWFAFTPEINKATPPITLEPGKEGYNIKFEKLDNFLTGGIYGSSTMENFNKYIQFPFQKQKANNFITNTLVESAPAGDFKISKIFSDSDIQFLDDRIIKNLKDNFLLFGAYSGAFLGILAIIQLIKSCISIGFNVRLLHKAFGAGFHLLAAIFGTVTSYLIANKAPKPDNNTETEAAETTLQDEPADKTHNIYPSHQLASA